MRPASVPPVSTSLLMSRMFGQHLAGALAEAEHDVEHAGRQARFGEDLRQLQASSAACIRTA